MGRRRQLAEGWKSAGLPRKEPLGKAGGGGRSPRPASAVPYLCPTAAGLPKRPKEAEDLEGEEKEGATLEGERPLPMEAEKNSTPSEPGSGRGPPQEEEEEEEEEEAAKEDAEAPGLRDHER